MGIAGTIQMPELDDIPEGEGTNWQLACTDAGFVAIAPDGTEHPSLPSILDYDHVNNSTDISTSSTSFVNMANMSVSVTVPSDSLILLIFAASFFPSGALNSSVQFHDGSSLIGQMRSPSNGSTAWEVNNMSMFHVVEKSGGTYTFTVQWKTNTATIHCQYKTFTALAFGI